MVTPLLRADHPPHPASFSLSLFCQLYAALSFTSFPSLFSSLPQSLIAPSLPFFMSFFSLFPSISLFLLCCLLCCLPVSPVCRTAVLQ